MMASVWIAVVLLAATPNCATDSCLWHERTFSIHVETEDDCKAVIEAFEQFDTVTFSKCVEVELDQ